MVFPEFPDLAPIETLLLFLADVWELSLFLEDSDRIDLDLWDLLEF